MKRTLFALALAAALPMSAQASELNYSFVELDYTHSSDSFTFPGVGADSTGFGLRGSYGFADHFYVNGGYTSNDYDTSLLSSFEHDEWELGFGYHRPLYDQADMFFEATFIRVDSSAVNALGGDKDNSYRVSAGLRGSISDRFEGTARLSYNDGADFGGLVFPQYDNAFSATVGLQWRINDMWGIVGEIEAFEDNTDYTLGVRTSF